MKTTIILYTQIHTHMQRNRFMNINDIFSSKYSTHRAIPSTLYTRKFISVYFHNSISNSCRDNKATRNFYSSSDLTT